MLETGFFLITLLLILTIFPFYFLILLITAGGFIYKLRRGRDRGENGDQKFHILIPAHNEEPSIGTTLQSLKEVSYSGDKYQITVIADNCTDDTAKIAKSCGVEVLERFDASKKSKGYALEYAIDLILKDPKESSDAFVIIDADTRVDPNMLTEFARELARGKDWLQAYYTTSNPDSSWRTQLLTYALSLFNGVWLMGQEGLGLGVALRGNGMCFRKEALRRFGWQAYGLAEDLEFSWRLKLAGEKVYFVADTKVYGEMVAAGDQGAQSQRQRWEKGRKALRQEFNGPVRAHKNIGILKKILFLLDLYMLPLSPLFSGLLVSFILCVILAVMGGVTASLKLFFALEFTMFGALFLYAISSLVLLRTPTRYLLALYHLPLYIGWKLVLFFKRKPTEWIRTPRG